MFQSQSKRYCSKKGRNTSKLNTVSEIKVKNNNAKTKECMKKIINNIEKLAKKEAKKNAVRLNDLSTTLPPKLYDRISKIIQLIPIKDDHFEDDNEKEVIQSENDYYKIEEFNESTASLIEILEAKYNAFEVNIEQKMDRKAKSKLNCTKNWFSEYICANRKNRIKWNTKLYTIESNIQDKRIDEQAEMLILSAAERFTDWVNNITENTETNITKELLMALFPVHSGADKLDNIQIDPKIMGAVPRKVAVTWGMPENSIDLKLANKIKEIMAKVPKKITKIAFGSTLPYDMHPWTPTDAYNIIKPFFPDELRKCKILFEGITHLHAIRHFIQHCKTNTDVFVPEYLVDVGCFKNKKVTENDDIEIPLYDLFNCHY